MKITFDPQAAAKTDKKHIERRYERYTAGRTESMSAANAAFARVGDRHLDGMAGGNAEKGKSLIELQQEAGNIDVGVQQDYMTLMSNTMSAKDYAKMQEEGFDFSGMDPEEAVTIVDKIKAELARAGKDIKGYTDDLDMKTLAAALGSDTLAQAVANSFAQADIPMTKENIAAVEQAWSMGSRLQPMNDGTSQYLIDNEMEPEIWNLYVAENSGAGQGSTVPKFYEEDVRGYYAQQYTGQMKNAVENGAQKETRAQGTQKSDMQAEVQPQGLQNKDAQGVDQGTGLQTQIDRVIERSGREVDQESREMAAWLLDRGLPLTEENLDRLDTLRQVELPLTEEAFAEASANAVSEGKSPVHASLAGGSNLYEKAAAVSEYYHSSEAWEKAVGDITARRQLEEIRLRMTAEVNVKLLKSGFAIDTAPMEQLIEALRQAEKELAAHYFPGDAHAVEKYRTYQNVNAVVSEMPSLPAEVLGSFVTKGSAETGGMSVGLDGYAEEDYLDDITPEQLYNTGKALQESYDKAQSRYEELMTSPRSDLGDSIQKAFGNDVDAILDYLGADFTDENRRAIRILGYNHMEMTNTNLRTVLEADRQVRTVLEKLTPAATLKMIRDGVNPLEKSFDELERYFDELPNEYKDSAQSYSRFLYGLEKNNKITPEEREGYIGIYRLVNQIEKSDGAAVGAVINTHAELHFANLLSAVRTNRVRSMDIRADVNAAAEMMRNGASISAQIAKAFSTGARKIMTEVSHSQEAEQEYNAQELETLRQSVASADRECIAMLQRGELSQSAENLMAAQALMNGSENIFRRLLRRADNDSMEDDNRKEDYAGEGEGLWEQLDDKEEFVKEYESTAQSAEDAVEEMTFEADSSVDVRRMQLLHKQLHVASALAKKEEYFLPMYLGDTLARVHLTMNRTGGNQGNVAVDVKFGEECIHADLRLVNGTVHGMFTTENQNDVMKLRGIADNFIRSAAGSWKVGEIRVSASRGAMQEPAAVEGARTENAELYRVAKVFLQSVKQGEV